MAVLLYAAAALVGFRLWMRLRETEAAVGKLTARVAALEAQRLRTLLASKSVRSLAPLVDHA